MNWDAVGALAETVDFIEQYGRNLYPAEFIAEAMALKEAASAAKPESNDPKKNMLPIHNATRLQGSAIDEI